MVFQFIGIQIFSMMYLLLILIVYSSKKRYASVENDIFKILLIFTIFELIVDIGTCYSIKYANVVPTINVVLCKFSLVGYQIWAATLMLYVLLLGNKNNYKSIKELYKKSWLCEICTIIVFLLAFIIFLLPISWIYDKTYNISYITGFCTTYNYIIAIIYLLIIFGAVILNKNKVSISKRIPIFFFVITSSIFLPIQRFNADVPVLIVPLMSFAIMIMYFTLENPDLKLINELNDLKLEAEESVKIKTKFLDNVSYSMRSPMNTIVSLSELLLTEKLSKDAKKDIENINNAGKTLLEMIDNTLDISKIEAGICEVNKEKYNLKTLIREVCLVALNSINKEKVKLVINIDENIPSDLYGDYTKLYRVLNNILINAIKYTNVGKITFNVKGDIQGDKINLIFKISDTGIGIKECELNNIFNKFIRIENEDTKGTEGTGLGLSISKKIIELLDGKISVDSTYGAGTTFCIQLYQQIIGENKIGKLNLNEFVNNKVNKFDGSLYKVLIVDDNKQNINVLKRLFYEYDIRCDSISSSDEETNLLNFWNKYDLIFIDQRIVNVNMIKIIKSFKEITEKKTILIALTDDAFNKSRKFFVENGYNDYIVKPINIMKLDEILNKYLNKK